eukprot:354654-Chlamydomonas_euryale.AAC.12
MAVEQVRARADHGTGVGGLQGRAAALAAATARRAYRAPAPQLGVCSDCIGLRAALAIDSGNCQQLRKPQRGRRLRKQARHRRCAPATGRTPQPASQESGGSATRRACVGSAALPRSMSCRVQTMMATNGSAQKQHWARLASSKAASASTSE